MTVSELLQKLVQTPSVNPDSVTEGPHRGEARMAEVVANFLEPLGFEVTLDEVLPERPNLIARAPGSDERPRILLGPHLDTVSVAGMTIDPFAGEIRDNCLWGRGASDTKGPIAAMLTALANQKDLLSKLPVAVDFVGFMGEENYQPGSKHFAKNHANDYEFAFVGEPTSLQFVNVTKGCLWAKLHSTGCSTHASQPHLGENAILKLTASLDLLNRKLSNRLATFTHPILGHSTLNIGTISGGTSFNIVPASAEAGLDIRFTPDLSAKGGALQLLEELIETHNLPVSITEPIEAPPMEVPPHNPYLEHCLRELPNSSLVGAPWFSDAAHLNEAGLPAVCIGPGSIDQAHTADEFIKLSDLTAGVEFFEALIISLQKQ